MLKDCPTYWWANMIFINDFFPFFDKDMNGCMRWTALFSIEMKLFLLSPLLAYFFNIGKHKLVYSLCLILILSFPILAHCRRKLG